MVETEAQKQEPHLEDEDLFEEFLLEGDLCCTPRCRRPSQAAKENFSVMHRRRARWLTSWRLPPGDSQGSG